MNYSIHNYNDIPNEFKKYKAKSISIKPNIIDAQVYNPSVEYYYKYIPTYYTCEYIYETQNGKSIINFKFYDESELFEMLDKALEVNIIICKIDKINNEIDSILKLFNYNKNYMYMNVKNKYDSLIKQRQVLLDKLKSMKCICKFETDVRGNNNIYNIELINI